LTATPDDGFGTDVIPVERSGEPSITTIPAVRVERTAADYLIRRLNFVLFDLGSIGSCQRDGLRQLLTASLSNS
ncbi:MAG: hypothetical protein ABSC73_09560, partial [Acidimicrobiales bacterium]